MSHPTLRRSPRLAEKAALALQPVAAAAPPPSPDVVATPAPKPKPAPKAVVPLQIKDSKTQLADIRNRKILLEDAKLIRHQLGQARTHEDFAACSAAADALWHKATRALFHRGSDEMFLSDVCHWINWGRSSLLGHVDHKYAISAIKSYIKCLEERLDDSYAKEYEDL